MKTTLPERSLVVKERLERIAQEIVAVAKHEVVMVILFGSYARGNWVQDSYVEDHIRYSYESDLDIMVIAKSPKFGGYRGNTLKHKIEKRLNRTGLRSKPLVAPYITLIVETIGHVNEQLEKSQYFYSDIKKEGILLYDNGQFTLAEPRDLSWSEQKEIARDYFDQWFPEGKGFLRDTLYVIQHSDFKRGAFYLHQAIECFYNTILLVFSGYKGKTHDIETLGSLASNYSNELLKIFHRDTEERKECFNLLQKAYIDARYNKNYKITEEQLNYLVQRVEKLKVITEEICQVWINK